MPKLPDPGLRIRSVETDADLVGWIRVRRIVVPDEPALTVERLRAEASAERLLLLAEAGGDIVGHGYAGKSSRADGYVAPRVLPEHRRRGIGSAILRALLDHHATLDHRSVASSVEDDGSMAFATLHGFAEVDRQVEQVRTVSSDEPAPLPFPGVEFATVADDPDLLRLAYPLAEQGYADLALAIGTAEVPLDEWLRDEATLPGGSIVALTDGAIVGYAGLLSWNDDDTRAENGLTVVDRSWRGRGLAAALKRRQLAWASAAGLREIVTWTQVGNEAMQHVNLGLGYVTRTVSRVVRRELP
jgi:RimJ/RimL family protein N-acetyltransferase